MKEVYIRPEMEILELNAEEVITTSVDNAFLLDENELPIIYR